MGQQPYAAVPAEALRRRITDELTSGAFDLYVQYISHYNRKTGQCDPGIRLLADEMGLTYNHVSDLKGELRAKGWIRRAGRAAVELLVGDFPPPNVIKFPGANYGKIRNSDAAGDGAGGANYGKIRNSITEKSVIGEASPYDQDQPDHDQPRIDDDPSSEAILTFYAELMGNPIRKGDRKSVKKVLAYPEHQVYAGIAASYLRAKRRINSFSYCIGAIEEMVQADASPDYLKYLMGHVARRRKVVQPSLPEVGADVVAPEFTPAEVDETRRASGEG